MTACPRRGTQGPAKGAPRAQFHSFLPPSALSGEGQQWLVWGAFALPGCYSEWLRTAPGTQALSGLSLGCLSEAVPPHPSGLLPLLTAQ